MPYRDRVVVDIGTGDGRFVSAHARSNPENFYIGIDANVKALEKLSMRATRKPAKGGLPNAMFVQAAVEDLPDELGGVAKDIHINFPWGSLLRAVATGDTVVLASLRRIAAENARLEIVIGVDVEKDATELARLGIPEFSSDYLREQLTPRYEHAGFSVIGQRELLRSEWAQLETSWARKLSVSDSRRVFRLAFQAT